MKNPVEVFDGLFVEPKFTEGLRPSQKQALGRFVEVERSSKVVAIELPTGSGKGVIGLLIAEAYRQDGKSVAYLCDTNALAEKVAKEAADLGIDATFIMGQKASADQRKREAELEAVKFGDKVGVFSYAGFLRGKGVPCPEVLIIDDAHAFEDQAIRSLSLTIDRSDHPALYQSLLALIAQEPSLGNLADIYGSRGLVDQDRVELVPFHIVDRLAAEILQRVKAAVGSDSEKELFWELPIAGDRISELLLLVARDRIAVRPYISSVRRMAIGYGGDKSIEEVEKLVLMSATLGSRETIKERFGIIESLGTIYTHELPDQPQTMGERIVVPLVGTGVSTAIGTEGLKVIASVVQDFNKALILCNSDRDRTLVRDELVRSKADPTPTLYTREGDVESFKQRSGGALLASNRTLGLDLGSRWCAVGVQPRIPYVLDPLDALKASIPRDVAYTREKVVQRMTQAFGRLNRGPHDRAVYFMMDERFPAEMRDDDFLRHFPTTLRAQIWAGWREGGESGAYADRAIFAKQFLSGKWTQYGSAIVKYESKLAKSDTQTTATKAKFVDAMIKGWMAVAARKLIDASKEFESIALALEKDDANASAWHYYLAAQMHFVASRKQGSKLDLEKLRRWLDKAYTLGDGAWSTRLVGIVPAIEGATDLPSPASTSELEAKRRVADNWRAFRRKHQIGGALDAKATPVDLGTLFFEGISKATHGQICHGLQQFLELAGYDRVVRERREGENLDVAAYSAIEVPRHVVVIEVKTRERDQTQVITKDIDQVVADAAAQLPDSTVYSSAHPVIATNRDLIHADALLTAEKCKVRIVNAAVLERFLSGYSDAMARFWKFDDAKQASAVIPHLPSPNSLKELFEFRGVVVATEKDADAALGKIAGAP